MPLRTRPAPLALLALVGLAGTAPAQQEPSDPSDAPPPISAEQANKEQLARRQAVEAFRNSGVEEPVTKSAFPWLPFGLCVIVLGGAAPFAWSYFREMEEELVDKDR